MSLRRSIISPILVLVFANSLAFGCRSGNRDEPTVDEARETRPPQNADERRDMALSTRHLNPKRTPQKPMTLPRQDPVRLIDAGAKPHRVLRYAQAADVRRFTVRAAVNEREFRDSTWTERVQLPTVEYGLDIRAATRAKDANSAPSKENSFTALQVRGLVATIADTEATEDPAAQAASAYISRYRDFLERRRAFVELDGQGRLGSVTLTPDVTNSEIAPFVRNEVLQLLLQSVIQWPVEAIGKGARWEAETLMYRGRGVVKQTATYQLIEAREDRIRVRAEIVQIGEHQIIDTPELPKDRVMELVALFWRLSGELQVSLDWPTPLGGVMDVEMRTHGRTVQVGRQTDHFLETAGTVTLTSEPVSRPPQKAPASVTH